ncbi:MAG: sigma 54-interacting transcriptional regulator [Myxococcota bacterium]
MAPRSLRPPSSSPLSIDGAGARRQPLSVSIGSTELAQRGSPEAAQRIRLSVVHGPDLGVTADSLLERLAVGTHGSNQLVLKDRTVSRFHCELTRADGRVRVRDLGSRNGTWIDGVQVQDAYLASGHLLSLGDTRLRVELDAQAEPIPLSARESFGSLLGRSPRMREVFGLLERAAPHDHTVLLIGETGTGKEGAAEAIHQESRRSQGPFVVVDCASIPRDLLESELFGHVRGAFTGAVSDRIGAFESAQGGTLFLDEIGELDLSLQPKLLRVLERREIRRVGSSEARQVDVRIVAATNRDLRSEVNNRRVRSDLYYRLAVLEIRIPPLRERVEDLPLLVDALATRAGASPEQRPSAAVLEELATHHWPGNVRELRNFVERWLTWPDQAGARLSQPPAEAAAPPELSLTLKVARERWNARCEREYLSELLKKHGGNVSAAARDAGVDRMHFYRRLWMYGLKKPGSDPQE